MIDSTVAPALNRPALATLSPPAYFTAVQARAQQIWTQLEGSPELAGPWWQLFRQVLSPRHVLSELLQNADDADATWARATIDHGDSGKTALVFEHNGVDFDQTSFESLCRFGFSNKRRLHTIGFRGIGFKSTFSLGPLVEVHTPTLAVGFQHERFTAPLWIDGGCASAHTVVRVTIDSPEKVRQMQAELERWAASPFPLLFFHSIQELRLDRSTIRRQLDGEGPVPRSQWVRLIGAMEERVLQVWSADEPFPESAIREIRDERGSQDLTLPPCRVDLIVGSGRLQRLYAVLPTEVTLPLPFSSNAPFVQDPARTGIKQPSMSATNTWLLGRIGKLAGETIQAWLGNQRLDLSERAAAYDMLPSRSASDGSAGQEAARIVNNGVELVLRAVPCLLTDDGNLANGDDTLAIPIEIHEVWSNEVHLQLFGPGKSDVLARAVPDDARERLRSRLWLSLTPPELIAECLQKSPAVPRPSTLKLIVTLWAYLQATARPGTALSSGRKLPIVPVRGKALLYPPERVLVIGDADLNIPDDDWRFIAERVKVVDPDWTRLMVENRNSAGGIYLGDPDLDRARTFFSRLGLQQRVGIQQVVDVAADEVFAATDPGDDGIKITQIAARLDVVARSTYRFLCEDGAWHSADEGLLGASDAIVRGLLPENWARSRLVSSRYQHRLTASELQAWRTWLAEPSKSQVRPFPIPQRRVSSFSGTAQLAAWCESRGGRRPGLFLSRQSFEVSDYDFPPELWGCWDRLALDNPGIWVDLAESVLRAWSEQWLATTKAHVVQRGPTKRYPLEAGQLTSAWLGRLRNLSCLPDLHDRPSVPSLLLRHTADTAPLIDIERFLAPRLDRAEYVEPLDQLGVRSQPAGIEKLIERVRALAEADSPPLSQLGDLYRALDRVALRIEPEKLAELRTMFSAERLIRTDDGGWQTSQGVYQDNSEDIPDASLVLAAVRELRLWDQIGVPKRPTLQLLLDWLGRWQPGDLVRGADRDRMRRILRRAPREVWERLGGWLDLSGRWADARQLEWTVGTAALASTLVEPIRQRTADLLMLDADSDGRACFEHLKSLESVLEWRVIQAAAAKSGEQPVWLKALGRSLTRLALPDPPDAGAGAAILQERAAAARLGATTWRSVTSLQVAPYLDGEQAGLAAARRAAWQGCDLFTVGPSATHHRELVDEVSRQFDDRDVRVAVRDCIGRDAAWIGEYVEANLCLEPAVDESVEPAEIPETAARGEPSQPETTAVAAEGEATIETDRDAQLSVPTEPTAETDDESEASIDPPSQSQPTTKMGARNRLRKMLAQQGFCWDDSAKLYHDANGGGTMRRSADLPIWVGYDERGNEYIRFWVATAPLHDGFDMPSEVWSQLESAGDNAWILVPEGDESLKSLSWERLQDGIKDGSIQSFFPNYRLRQRGDPW